jgi:pyruvate/2-oxoglutarate dehydrogenase complex dihydrolipoamide dehydrogenase (E3) component
LPASPPASMAGFDFDFAVLGGGSAGYAAASLAARAGLRTVVVDGGAEVGGLCILRGCMPSKTLLATAARAETVRHAAAFGVRATFSGIDGTAMQTRKRRLVSEFADYRRGQLESGRFAFLRGKARFTSPHSLLIEASDGADGSAQVQRPLTARTFLIATGSRIQTPPVSGLAECGFLDSDRFLETDRIPASVTVLGGGAIALEAATFYAGVGSRVTVLQRSNRILKEADPDVSEALTAGLRSRGIRVETNVQLCSAHASADGKVVVFTQEGVEKQVVTEEILCALGREAATRGLGLESCGIALAGSRVAVSATQQTSLPHVFAAGDVCGPLEVVHLAIQQAETAARNAVRLLGGQGEPLEETDYRLKLLAIFSEPGMAMAGVTETGARAGGIPFLTASYPFNDHGKSMVEEQLDGFVKLLVHAETREIMGAAVVGPHAAELIHEIVVAMHFRATAGDLARIPHYHPTLSEIWTYPAEELS